MQFVAELNELLKIGFVANERFIAKLMLIKFCKITFVTAKASYLSEKYANLNQNMSKFCAEIVSDSGDIAVTQNAKFMVEEFGGKVRIFEMLLSIRRDIIEQLRVKNVNSAEVPNKVFVLGKQNELALTQLQLALAQIGQKFANGETATQNAIKHLFQVIKDQQLKPDDLITLITGPIWNTVCQEFGIIDGKFNLCLNEAAQITGKSSTLTILPNDSNSTAENIMPKNSNLRFRRRKRDDNRNSGLIALLATTFILMAISFGVPKILFYVEVFILMWFLLWFISKH
uniref:Uncharacterized protein n=1 Tax=Globodera rostochiensis TaxID=31243 RepID=A0A914HKS8_GLORO